MSHELRTPLNAILGFATLLKKSNHISEVEKQNISTIYSSGQHLLSLINEILEFAKIEAGKVNIVSKEFNLYKLFDDIESIFTSRCEAKNLKFELNINKEVPNFIKCDEIRLRQIFINILGNALKFTHEGFIKVEVSFEDSKLIVQVLDSGVGMSEEALKVIFKPFEQIEEKKYKHEGTGLGLAITKELIEKMGGKISVQSKEGKGSQFDFEIKIKKIDSIKEESYDKEGLIKVKKPYNFEVLVADDTKENRDLLLQLLHSYNLKTTEASDGEEVLKHLEKKTFDLIFMDILMPNLDGLETTKVLKAKEFTKQIPVIAISANVFEDDKQKALGSGADYFLPKPFEEKDITTTLEKFLNMEFEYEEEAKVTKEEFLLEQNEATKIKEFAKNLDGDSILKILSNENINTKTKKEIRGFVEQFNYQKIIELCS